MARGEPEGSEIGTQSSHDFLKLQHSVVIGSWAATACVFISEDLRLIFKHAGYDALLVTDTSL
jgi:hypothetical protein